MSKSRTTARLLFLLPLAAAAALFLLTGMSPGFGAPDIAPDDCTVPAARTAG